MNSWSLVLPVAVFVAATLAFTVIPAWVFFRANRHWVASTACRRSSLRAFETSLVVVGLLVMAFDWLFRYELSWPPRRFDETTGGVQALNIKLTISVAVIGVTAIGIAWKRSTATAIATLFLCGGGCLATFQGLISEAREAENRSQSEKWRSRHASNRGVVFANPAANPQWEKEIESLLDRARLNGYSTDEAWQTAFKSYGEYGLTRLQSAKALDPRIALVQEDQIAVSSRLKDIKDSASAWRLLMQIEEEARQTGSYSSVNVNGQIVDRLVPLLEPQQLVDHALQYLKRNPHLDPGRIVEFMGDRLWSKIRFRSLGNQSSDETAFLPIAQAILKLDQLLDEEPSNRKTTPNVTDSTKLIDVVDPSTDNLVERTLTPELIRMCYHNSCWSGNAFDNPFRYINALGGSHYESFLLRNKWEEFSAKPGRDNEYIGNRDNVVNTWYYQLMQLRSPVGVAFRRLTESSLLSIARNCLATEHDTIGNLMTGELSFLFLDREFSDKSPSLAMRFWQDVKNVTASETSHTAAQLRWEYLGRLWPESTPSMFVAAVQDMVRADISYARILKLPDTMPLADQYQVLMAVIQDQQQTVATIPRVPGDDNDFRSPRQKHLQLIRDFRELLYKLPCEQAAAQLLADMKAEPDHSWHKSIADFLKYDMSHEDLIRLIATGDDIKLQRDVLPAIQNHPIPERVQWLDVLLKSPDETVRTEAAVVKTYLDNLRTQSLPHRSELRK